MIRSRVIPEGAVVRSVPGKLLNRPLMLTSFFRRLFSSQRQSTLLSCVNIGHRRTQAEVEYRAALSRYGTPRVAVVKQDINEDLYCCAAGSNGREVIESTLLRSGPVGLFSDWNAQFLMLETVDDQECTIWQERATKLHWDTLEFFRSYQLQVPGRHYGQQQFAVSVDSVDWNQFDIVISIDNSVPARVTRQFPQVLWCYYVRELKTPEYTASLSRPLPGQDVVFSHQFAPSPVASAAHVLHFPYHLHRFHCLQDVFGESVTDDRIRSGIFIDHHTMTHLSSEERSALQEFGRIASTIHQGDREVIPTSEKLARRTLDPDLRERLFNSRYFLVTQGKRSVFGTGLVEAISAGCLVIGTPERIGCAFLLSDATSASDVSDSIRKMRMFEDQPELRQQELQRQRDLVDWLCFYRPLQQLVLRWNSKSSSFATPKVKTRCLP